MPLSAGLTIDDEAVPDFMLSLLELEVEEDHDVASAFRVRLATLRADQGLWRALDDERVRPWRKAVITVTVADEEEELIAGFITQIRTHLDAEEANSYVEISGLDATCLMNLEDKLKDWPNKSDSDIAREIFGEYQLSADVEETGVIHEEAVSTIIQRETDIQFLRRLARRNGYECVVRGDQAFFRRPVLTDLPMPVLAAHFGGETNLGAFDARWLAMRPTRVVMHGIDAVGKEVVDSAAEAGEQAKLGRDDSFQISPPSPAEARIVVRHAVGANRPEMDALTKGILHDSEFLIEARGEIDSVVYGSVLRSRALVPIKGVGEMFSGTYFVTSVRHVFTVDRYVQHFTARRNAAFSTPADFTGGGLLPF